MAQRDPRWMQLRSQDGGSALLPCHPHPDRAAFSVNEILILPLVSRITAKLTVKLASSINEQGARAEPSAQGAIW